MRIILNVDAVRDPANCTKRKLRIRTSFKYNSDDHMAVARCGLEVYGYIMGALDAGIEGVLVEHQGEQR